SPGAAAEAVEGAQRYVLLVGRPPRGAVEPGAGQRDQLPEVALPQRLGRAGVAGAELAQPARDRPGCRRHASSEPARGRGSTVIVRAGRSRSEHVARLGLGVFLKVTLTGALRVATRVARIEEPRASDTVACRGGTT